MAKSLAYLFAAGVSLALVNLILLQPAGGELRFLAPLAAVSVVSSVALMAILLLGARRLRLWAFNLILASGTALISAALFFSKEDLSTLVMFYVLVTLYGCYFFTRLQAVAQVGFVAVSYAIVLFSHESGSAPVARWLLTIGTLVAAGGLLRMLRERVERLIERLADAARTDVLTGLLNRRGFQELFDVELERASRGGRPLGVLVADIDHFKQLNDRFGHHEGDRALERLAGVLGRSKRRIDTAARIGGEEFAILMPDTDERAAFIVAERLRRQVREAFADGPKVVTISLGVAAFPKHGGSPESLLHAADQALYAAKELGRDRAVIHNPEIAGALAGAVSRRTAQGEGYLATLLALAESMDIRDSGAAHSQAVGHLAELTARHLGLPGEVTERVRLAGILHDIGKIGVSDAILRKPGSLTEEDWVEVHRHPEIAARVLDSTSVDDVRAWVVAHHERPDGRGYPLGLRDEAIPLEAKIVAVAEAYEAMTSDRVYRSALAHEEAAEELRRGAGTQFSGVVVEALIEGLEEHGSHGHQQSSSRLGRLG